jgi:hypothetical protein
MAIAAGHCAVDAKYKKAPASNGRTSITRDVSTLVSLAKGLKREEVMSSDAYIADASAVEVPSVHHARNSEEAAALKGFIVIAALVVAATIGLGATYGMAGVGALAIALAGAMLVFLVYMTAGE